jgi:hypothetical protein
MVRQVGYITRIFRDAARSTEHNKVKWNLAFVQTLEYDEKNLKINKKIFRQTPANILNLL